MRASKQIIRQTRSSQHSAISRRSSSSAIQRGRVVCPHRPIIYTSHGRRGQRIVADDRCNVGSGGCMGLLLLATAGKMEEDRAEIWCDMMPVRHARLPNLVATTFIDCISRLVSDWKLIRDARLRRGRWRRRPAASAAAAAAARADDRRRKCATQSRRHQSRRRRRPSFRRGNFICSLLRFLWHAR